MAVDLTPAQEEIVAAEPDFLLLACPGSGKTRAAAARIARLQREGTRVGVCSYTNVGADRIASTLAADHNVYLEPRHFNGTLHKLLLRYVVYPFAYLLGAEAPVRMWHGKWPTVKFQGDPKRQVSLDAFRRDPDGNLVLASPPRWVGADVDEVVATLATQVTARKRGIFRAYGATTPDDAMWIALEILRSHSAVAEAVAGRFQELLIDEAQDTSQLQLACVKELRESGRLESLVMVGDLEQSIYEYQGSSAEACRKFATDRGLRTIELQENHRSSQKLCNVAAHFCERQPDDAVGPHKDCPIDPEVVLYPSTDPAQAMMIFRERLEAHGIAATHAAVLARSGAMVARLSGKTTSVAVEDRPLELGKIAAALASGRLSRWDVERAAAMLLYGAFGDREPEEIDDAQREQLRRVTQAFIRDLPPLQGTLKEWIESTRAPFAAATTRLADPPAKKAGLSLRTKAAQASYQASDFFAVPPADLQPQTVHSLKGEDREAVMLVVSRPHGGDPAKQLDLFEAALGGAEITSAQQQERRVNYVALTRAERYCLLALPDTPRGQAVASSCQDIGFAPVP
jgi:DNA helicase-2/ATP-dependent DNA helicase PcrA